MVVLKHETGFRWLYSPVDDKCGCLGAEATTYCSMYTKLNCIYRPPYSLLMLNCLNFCACRIEVRL
jgi:hypothetical protein